VRVARRGSVIASALVAIALLAASACGGSSDDDDGAAAADADALDSGSADADAQALVFAECMRDNGVDMPDPGPGQEGLGNAFQAAAEDVDEDTMRQAMSACEDLMPQYASEEMHDDEVMLDLAECLREQGLDVSDNPFTDMHAGEIDQSELSAAMEVCRDVLMGGGQ
jgi:hypothetical protein